MRCYRKKDEIFRQSRIFVIRKGRRDYVMIRLPQILCLAWALTTWAGPVNATVASGQAPADSALHRSASIDTVPRLHSLATKPAPGHNRRHDLALADSVMAQVIRHAPLFRQAVDEYRAGLYLKGLVHVKKKNVGIRFLPSMFRLRKGVKDYLMETYSDLHFTAPDTYDHRVKANVGTANEFWEADGRLLEFFRINIYSPTILYDKLISPLSPEGCGYYRYRVDSVGMAGVGEATYRIRFTPRSESFQLLEGYVTVTAGRWSIREMVYSGRSEMLTFRSVVTMGRVGQPDEYLPTGYEMEARFHLLGNAIDGRYTAVIDYQEIRMHDGRPSIHLDDVGDSTLAPQDTTEGRSFKRARKSRYDLSDSYTLTADTNANRRDTAYFNTLRPLPLTLQERQLYADYFASRDTAKRVKSNSRMEFFGQVGDVLVSRYTLDLNRYGDLKFSPIVNPLLLSYSGTYGLSYRQEFKYNRLYSHDRLLRIVPQVGYNFKEKEFYWRIKSDYDYWPRRRSAIHVDFGSGNRIYSSDVLDELKAMPDSIFDFSQIHLDYFRDLYLNLNHSWEITNGLTFDVGISMHRRTEVDRSRFVLLESANSASVTDLSILNKLHHTYNSFAPNVALTWRPGQYYYMNGERKVNLYADYPTLSVKYERGISGILKNSGSYERWEVDVQHNLSIGLMRHLYLRMGWGKFTNQRDLFFVDFANLKRSSLPMGWADDIGGVFQLLDGRWYNSSRKYLRGNAVYESPFILLRHLRSYTRHVLNERLYLNALVMPHLNPYVELGYGIGTHIFDFGFFAAFANGEYDQVGIKFTFELFNR